MERVEDDTGVQSAPIRDCSNVRNLLLLIAVRLNDSLELEITDPKDNEQDIE